VGCVSPYFARKKKKNIGGSYFSFHRVDRGSETVSGKTLITADCFLEKPSERALTSTGKTEHFVFTVTEIYRQS